ncbi:hypothetical protein KFE25_001870 [Diacronema lutheri]|uniref:Uncharacterized protein n=1 Tax=Diacronema lutheri TaxID=2081491 RepID=A0A8J5XT75_DIALT|nr:hypothetical protein KFE25_001870 [Diacronema lutheri]
MSTNFFESVREKKPAELAEEYAREKARSTQLRAALTQLEHLERIELGAEPPKDVLPLPKPGDRPYSQEVYVNQSGSDSLFTGLSKRTPIGGFFSS